jgi:isopropylmalate/homocitrate/citramalate synthase
MKGKLIPAEPDKRKGTDKVENVENPNLYRDIFPYTQVSRIPFDGVSEEINLPDEIWITDTTFRDGMQSRPPYSVEEIVDIFKLMHRLGGETGLIRQSEFFLYSEKDRKAVEKCLALGYEFPKVTGWIRAAASDFELVKQMELEETGILTSSSDYHIFRKLGKTREEALQGYIEIVEAALKAGIRPRCHFEDITRADFYGFVIPFAREIVKLSEESGIRIKVRLCDTMGYGVPYQGAALPRSVPKLVRGIINEGGLKPEQLEWHGHNDFHKVLVNGVTAWLYGCCGVNGTLLGLGERTGNPPVEGLVIEYISLTGNDDAADTRVITEIADYFTDVIGADIPANYPFVGSSFNVTRAGIHADGALKDDEIYNIFDTGKLLNRLPGVVVTDKSGTAGLAFWINENILKDKDMVIDKRSPGILQIYEWISREYEQGRVTGISDRELYKKVKEFLPELLEEEDEED